MKILLTKPPKAQYPLGYKGYAPMIPMGLGFIAKVLHDYNIDYAVLDNYLDSFYDKSWTYSKYEDFLKKYRPTHICISVMSIEWAEALNMINYTRLILPEVKIILGGPHTTFCAEKISPFVDYVIIGEGEYAVIDVLRSKIIEKYLKGNVIKYPFIDELDQFYKKRNPCDELIPWKTFLSLGYNIKIPEMGLTKGGIVNLNTSRGCPCRCKFCSNYDLWGRDYRCLSAHRIIEEIEVLNKKYNIKGFCFREDNFATDNNRLVEFCNLLIEKKINIEWAAEMRVDFLDYSILYLMKQSGCKGLLFGVESGSKKVLELMHKDISTEQICRTFNICKQVGILSYASIVYGVPGETAKDRQLTKKLLKEINPDYIEESIYLGIPGSIYYKELKKMKKYEYYDDTTLHLYPIGYKDLYCEIMGKKNIDLLPY